MRAAFFGPVSAVSSTTVLGADVFDVCADAFVSDISIGFMSDGLVCINERWTNGGFDLAEGPVVPFRHDPFQDPLAPWPVL